MTAMTFTHMGTAHANKSTAYGSSWGCYVHSDRTYFQNSWTSSHSGQAHARTKSQVLVCAYWTHNYITTIKYHHTLVQKPKHQLHNRSFCHHDDFQPTPQKGSKTNIGQTSHITGPIYPYPNYIINYLHKLGVAWNSNDLEAKTCSKTD